MKKVDIFLKTTQTTSSFFSTHQNLTSSVIWTLIAVLTGSNENFIYIRNVTPHCTRNKISCEEFTAEIEKKKRFIYFCFFKPHSKIRKIWKVTSITIGVRK